MQNPEFLNKVNQETRLSEDQKDIRTKIEAEDEDDDKLFTYNSAEEMIADALGDPNWKNSR